MLEKEILKSQISGGLLNMIEIPISVGELVDKITILQIKSEKINDLEKLSNIHKELNLLNNKLTSLNLSKDVYLIQDQLKLVNTLLWEVEDVLRDYEREGNFLDSFIEKARSVYKLNDQRFILKKKINYLTNSDIVEEKSYKEY